MKLQGSHHFPAQSLESVLSEVISGRNWGKGVAEGNLFSDWRQIVGDEISEHTTPISLVDGRLTIQSSSSAWATQMMIYILFQQALYLRSLYRFG